MSDLKECPHCNLKPKPCPFCGGADLVIFANYVGCTNINCQGNIDFGDWDGIENGIPALHHVIEAWNKRDDGWISVSEKPKHGQSVICFYINSHGNKRMVIGHYFHRWTEESLGDDDCCDEYSDEKDEYYYKEGWYEQQENWGDYASIFIHEGEVIYWKKRPKFPEVN